MRAQKLIGMQMQWPKLHFNYPFFWGGAVIMAWLGSIYRSVRIVPAITQANAV